MQRYLPSSSTYTYYAFDPQGTVVNRYRSQDPPGQFYDTSIYGDFGHLYTNSLYSPLFAGQQTVPYDEIGYCGQWGCYTDAYVGLVQMGYRVYTPEDARFVTRDPSGLAAGLNLYTYCNNNPVNFIDPMGTQAVLLLTTEKAAEAGYVWVGTNAATVATVAGIAGTESVLAGALTVGALSTTAVVGGAVIAIPALSYGAYQLSSHYIAPWVVGPTPTETFAMSPFARVQESIKYRAKLKAKYANSPKATALDVPKGRSNTSMANIIGWGGEGHGGATLGQSALNRFRSLTQKDVVAMKSGGLKLEEVKGWQALYWKHFKFDAGRGKGFQTPFYRYILLEKIARMWPK